jgi:mannose-6-phosphate isomerase
MVAAGWAGWVAWICKRTGQCLRNLLSGPLKPILREKPLQCEQFSVIRLQGDTPFSVGAPALPRVLVCLGGSGQLDDAGQEYPFHKGDVILLPAIVGTCSCRPRRPTRMLEISLPQIS